MSGPSPEYFSEYARQIGFQSAFLGGVSATFLAQLLALNSSRKVVSWCLVLAAGAAGAFIASALGSSLLVLALDPGSGGVAPTTQAFTLTLASVPYAAGLLLLLATIGLSGWVRSRRVGLVTTSTSTCAALLGALAIATF